jgi:hypothetical protein
VFVDEFSSYTSAEVPGWTAGWLASLESGNVDEANRACWTVTSQAKQTYDECKGGVVDGVLTYNARYGQPNFWVNHGYAAMTGNRVTTTTSDQAVTAFATKNDATSQMSVLLGRHQTCTAGVVLNPPCNQPTSATPPPASVKMTLNYPYAAQTATVNVSRVPNAGVTSGGISPVSETPMSLPVTNGVVTFTVPKVADGEAYMVQVQKAT